MAVSIFHTTAVTLLWFFTGIFGLHLFYVGRNTEGVFHLTTCGVFGFGWFGDLTRLTTLAREASGDPLLVDETKELKRREPSTSIFTHVFQILVGNMYWLVASISTRVLLHGFGLAPLLPVSTVCMVAGALGCCIPILGYAFTDQKATSITATVATVVGIATLQEAGFPAILPGQQTSIVGGVLISRLKSRWSKRKRPEKDILSPAGMILITVLLVGASSAVCYSAYQAALNYPIVPKSAELGDIGKEGTEYYTLREIMRETGQNGLFALYDAFMNNPEIFYDLFQVVSSGEMSVGQAKKLLGLADVEVRDLDKKMVDKAFRQMSLKYHPDKYEGPKDEAQAMQIQLGSAKEVLIKSLRS